MTTFTVFCYGTGEKNGETNNIISQFSAACKEGESTYIDGPGLLGTEVQANADEGTARILNWLQSQEGDNHTINLAGFSRGSVTSIYIANNLKRQEEALTLKKQQLIQEGRQLEPREKKLLTQLKNINLNLFLMDPVAGMSDKSKMDGRVLPDNVKSCVTVLQTDEMRRDFKPQDITRLVVSSPKTKVTMLPMYGNHSDNTKIKSDGMTAGPQIVWHSLHQFLTQHGTRFKGDAKPEIVYSKGYKPPMPLPPNPSGKELLELFSLNHEERGAFLKSGMKMNLSDGMPVPRAPRTLNKHLRFYVKNSDFFTNQLERELFKIAYPKIFNYLFEKNQFDIRFPNESKRPKAEVEAELATLKQDNPKLFNRLVESRRVQLLEMPEGEKKISIGAPRGLYSLEPCASVQQMFPNLVTHDLITQHAPQMNKLSQLEMDVYRFTFRYQREKSSFNFSGKRAEHDRAKEIRNEINELVNHDPADNNTKYNRILDKLERHYRDMVQAASTSDLVPMLKDVLNRHGRQYKIQDPGVLRTILSSVVHTTISLLRESISFVGNLGYIGGGVLFAAGHAIQAIGRRANDILGTLGYNPLKYVASAIAYTLEGVGFAIKNSFGLKPLTACITSGLSYIRDAMNRAINNTQIDKLDVGAQQREPIVPESQEPVLPKVRESNPELSITKRDELREPLLETQHESEPEPESAAIHKTVDFKHAIRQQREALLSTDIPDDVLDNDNISRTQLT